MDFIMGYPKTSFPNHELCSLAAFRNNISSEIYKGVHSYQGLLNIKSKCATLKEIKGLDVEYL